MKDKYEYEDIIGVKNKLIGTLPFRVNGYVFKCLENASYDILYIFPECRNKQVDDVGGGNGSSPLTLTNDKSFVTLTNDKSFVTLTNDKSFVTLTNDKSFVTLTNDKSFVSPPCGRNNSSTIASSNGGNGSSSHTGGSVQQFVQQPAKQKVQPAQSTHTISNMQIKGKDDATFLMKKTEFPDVYEIYMFDSSNSKKAKIGYAGIPNIECSVMVKNWFLDKEEIYAKCKKNPVNEKWIPVQLL
jgi:hypothetical protein